VKWWLTLALLVLLALAALIAYVTREIRREHRYDPEIRSAAERYRVDPALVKAVVWRESRFNAGVRGTKGELGLMQLQEIAAQEWADSQRITNFVHEHCLDPVTNTLAGTFYLGKLLRRYANTDDAVPYALADYNAGRSYVLKWSTNSAATNSAAFIEQIGFPGTKAYVKVVMRRLELYRPQFRP
jgi:soluble lytic murein transglycosylase